MPIKRGVNAKKTHILMLSFGLVAGMLIALLIGTLMMRSAQSKEGTTTLPTPSAPTKPTLAPTSTPTITQSQDSTNINNQSLGAVPQLYRSTEAPIGIQARIAERDYRVDQDNLYPPVSREAPLAPLGRDTFRPVAYIVAEETATGRDVWKLYARERGRGGASDFYAVSADRQFDAKVALTDENVRSHPRLRDVYNLPDSIQITHPMFQQTTYKVVEMDRADWGNMPNYY